ncbi:MAG: lysophospholipid acyltransferase family protein [Alphaproteobacteria bacterium]
MMYLQPEDSGLTPLNAMKRLRTGARLTLMLGWTLTKVGLLALLVPLWFMPLARQRYAQSYLFGLRYLAGIRVTVIGREHLPKAGQGAVLVANHLSHADIAVKGSMLPATFVAGEHIRHIPHARFPVGLWFANIINTLVIDRKPKGDKALAIRQQVAGVARRVKQGMSVVIFPEGTTTAGRMLPFKAALFGALEDPELAHVPVIPVTLSVDAHSLPHYTWAHDDHRSFTDTLVNMLGHRRFEVTVVVHPPLPQGLDRKQMAARAEATIRHTYNQLHHVPLANMGDALPLPV